MGITVGKSWMASLRTWVQGQRHPNTPQAIYENVRDWDHLRRVLYARCTICGFVVSRDEKQIKELAFVCDNPQCDCHKMYGPISHRVCDICYHMYHALYVNYGLKSMNYFKSIDEKIKADLNDKNKKDRLGL